MFNKWRRLFLIVTILLICCISLTCYLWYQLNNTKYQLATAKTQLATTVAELDTTKKQLDNTKAQLDNTTKELVKTEGQLANVEDQLDFTNAELSMTRSQLQAKTNENNQMLNQYDSLKDDINIRLAITPENRQSFITPNNSIVSDKVQEITGGYSEDTNEYWRDCDRLYKWVVNNISYSYDSYMAVLPENISGELTWRQECWRMPEETIADETGDCEDMALLLASMIDSYNEGRYAVWCIEINSNIPGISGHMAVAFPVQNNNIAILDPAGNYYSGREYGTLSSERATVGINKWISYWESKIPEAFISAVLTEDSYYEFNDTAGFLEWLKERN